MTNVLSHAFILLLLTAVSLYAAGAWHVRKSFPAPGPMTAGLTWDGQYLWSSCWFDNHVYKVDPNSGTAVASLVLKETIFYQEDLAWAQGCLWMVDANSYTLNKFDPSTGDLLDKIQVDRSLLPPSVSSGGPDVMNGLTWDGSYFWANLSGLYFVQIDPLTKSIVYSNTRVFGAADDYLDGLTWAWNHLFVVTNYSATIFEVDPCSGFPLNYFMAPAGKNIGPEGMAFDGEYLWYADNTTERIYQLELVDDYQTKSPSTDKRKAPCGNGIAVPLLHIPDAPTLSVFPNPAGRDQKLQIRIDKGSRMDAAGVRILDICGRTVYAGSLEFASDRASVPWPLGLSKKTGAGFYVVEVKSGSMKLSKRVLLGD